MKRLVCLFAAIALAAPLYAQSDPNVYIECAQDGGAGSFDAIISYDATTAGTVRGFALDISVNTGTIDSISGFKTDGYSGSASTSGTKGYGVHMGRIDFGGDPNTVDDWGTPEADPCDPGNCGQLGSGCVTFEFGSLYDPDNTADSPDLTGDLLTITVSTLPCTVSIGLNDTRAQDGVVLEDLSPVDFVGSSCEMEEGDEVPPCWTIDSICYGDTDDNEFINTDDFGPFRDSFYANYWDDPLGTDPGDYNPCGDWDMNGVVNTDDFGGFRTWFYQDPPDDCSPGVWPPEL